MQIYNFKIRIKGVRLISSYQYISLSSCHCLLRLMFLLRPIFFTRIHIFLSCTQSIEAASKPRRERTACFIRGRNRYDQEILLRKRFSSNSIYMKFSIFFFIQKLPFILYKKNREFYLNNFYNIMLLKKIVKKI